MEKSVLKLRLSLKEHIEQWMEEVVDSDGWRGLDTYFANETAELMTNAAFTVLLAQSKLSHYLRTEKVENI